MGISRNLKRWYRRIADGRRPAGERIAQPAIVHHEGTLPELSEYLCGRYTIILPSSHQLPFYQNQNPLYDRFLPILAQQMPDDALIIDVGANVGDTLASMATCNERLKYICIEPEPTFYALLETNAARMVKATAFRHPPRLLNYFVGKMEIKGTLVSQRGTAHVDATATRASDPAEPDYISLERVLTEAAFNRDSKLPTLIKSDVDGWDFNVICSLGLHMNAAGLLIYMECQSQTEHQYQSFVTLFATIKDWNLTFTIFDNFGNLLTENGSADDVQTLLEYVWHQEQGIGTRTIWYLDVLISTPQTRNFAASAVQAYKKKYYSRPASSAA